MYHNDWKKKWKDNHRMTEKDKKETRKKLQVIIDALQEKKAKDIVTINLEKVNNSICDYFVICHGSSTTQVDSLSEAVQQNLKDKLKTNAHHIEGLTNSIWVLMDYFNILVHVFLEDTRKFYNLEELWADGKLERIVDEN